MLLQPQVWRPKYNLFTLKGPGLQAAEDYNCDWATVTEVQKLLRVGRQSEDARSTKLLQFDIPTVSTDNNAECLVPCSSRYPDQHFQLEDVLHHLHSSELLEA